MTPILLFAGAGTSPNDVAALETILQQNDLRYSALSSSQLNQMTEQQLAGYSLLIVPGGNFIDIGNSLTGATTANVRDAVQDGLNYLGICAGGFLAGTLPAPYKAFNLTSGVQFGFYEFGTRKKTVRITAADGSALDQYWEDGPRLTAWGDVIGQYPDGTPAVVQHSVGKGMVVLTGIHPEAPESWRRGMSFNTPASDDTAYTTKLILAALNRTPLRHFTSP